MYDALQKPGSIASSLCPLYETLSLLNALQWNLLQRHSQGNALQGMHGIKRTPETLKRKRATAIRYIFGPQERVTEQCSP